MVVPDLEITLMEKRLPLHRSDDVVQVGGADAVAAEVDLGAALQLVVELALHGLHHGTGTQIAAADAGHDQHVGILTDLLAAALMRANSSLS